MTTPGTTPDLLAELTCRDPQRVWAAAHAVIRAPDATLLALVPHLAEIRRATHDLDLGGAFTSNKVHLDQALRVLEAARDGRCHCTLYPTYLFYDPAKQAEAGHVTIEAHSPPDWNMTYRCRCRHCGQKYDVSQGESHVSWWEWRPTQSGSRPPLSNGPL